MANIGERSDRDLLPDWKRKDDTTLIGPGGDEWRHVRRRELSAMTEDDWRTAVLLLRRPPTGWKPCRGAGKVLQDLLIDFGPIHLAGVLSLVGWWTNDEDPHDFIVRGVRDKRAHLMVAVPLGGNR